MNAKTMLNLAQETWSEFQKDEATQLSAALSYYALFSIFPLLLLLVALLGYVLNYLPSGQDAQSTILSAVSQNFSPQLSEIIAEALNGVKDQAAAATGVGLITLLLGASGVFQQLDSSFNKIWKVSKNQGPTNILATIRSLLTEKATAFGMVLAVGLLLLISTTLTALMQSLLEGTTSLFQIPSDSFLAGGLGQIVSTLLTIALNTLIFALLFRFLPNARVRWGDVWLGALITAAVWEIAKRLLAIYIGSIGAKSAAYGAIGAVLVLVAWIYFSSLILYLGGEFTYVYANWRRKQVPSTEAMTQAAETAASSSEDKPETSGTAPAPSYNQQVAQATGRGFLYGAIGGIVAVFAMLIGGGIYLYTMVTRTFRRS